ncbi:putative receptor protein kinase ZmPK1 [Cicer arietinum]|uniref:Receptor-like serine/threonine-protein kinase n=1 Tax=Cicer arietinum TaxID=3827 RepID=A0A1S2Y6R3_CICAR|nr:putative receptor protein kinase ZmPK1 [Cicer arietinum]
MILTMNSSPILFALLILLFHFHYSSSSFSLSVENLEQDIIVSPKRIFTAGFYPVGENAYSFAIWFTQKHKHLNDATIVWMANRDQPVNGKKSTLSLLKTGNLILTDAAQSIVWSTNTASSKPLQLSLRDTGNLILQEHNNSNSIILWQSFDFPTDTLLPQQTLTTFTKLISSRSETNYSSGFYKLFFDNYNLLCLVYDGLEVSSVYWPDPLILDWQTSRSTYNSNRVATLNRFGNFSSSDGFTFRTSDYGTVLQRRLKLDFDGNVRVYSRENGQEKWSMSGQFNQQPCKIHGICGPNSTCSYDPITGRKCYCLPGYSIINNQDWSQGCKPSFQVSCNNNNKLESRFKLLPHVEFYDYDYGFQKNYTYKHCKHLCLRLCECIAFQFRYVKNKGLFNCYPKTRLLNGRSSTKFGGSLFLRLPKNNSLFSHENSVEEDVNSLVCLRNEGVKQLGRSYVNAKENGSLKFMLRFAGGLGGVELLGFFLVWCFLFRSSKNSNEDNNGYVLAAATGFRRFNYSELKQATKGFSQEIGCGAGGKVYKGVLSDNRIAAIKRLHEAHHGESESEFLAEVNIIGRLNHMNLIGMWGYCAEGKHRLLVYEYMEKGTLADNLSSNELDWGKRYNIALGTAKGLAYLHEECLEWVLHCDIKPQNILVDSDYQPKVADFGLSKLLNRDDLNNSNFSRIRGTRGYMAPEWVFNSQITSKVDVYSYGVVVLEMITGKSPTTGIQIKDGEELCHERLVTWVREKRRKGIEVGCWVEQIVDPALGSNYDVKKMETLANVALDCVAEERDMRPSMSQVVERLQSQSASYLIVFTN